MPNTLMKLIQIWREVFDQADIKADADFFALGGTSLIAMRLIGRIGITFGVTISYQQLFDHPTLTELATLLENPHALPPYRRIPRAPRRSTFGAKLHADNKMENTTKNVGREQRNALSQKNQ